MTTPAAVTPAAPTNGAASKVVTPSNPAPSKDVAAGVQTPSPGAVRGPDGKFTSANPAPKPPADDDPEIDFNGTKLKRSVAWREIQRSKDTARLLTEAEKRHRAAEAKEKAYEERKSKKDIGAVLAEFGLTPEEEQEHLAKYLYSKHIAPGQMTPEQREVAELKAWRAEREAADAKAKETQAAEAKKAVLSEEAGKLEQDIIAAAKAGKIPTAPAAMRRILAKALSFDERGMVLPLEQIASIVRDEVAADVGEVCESTSIEERKALMGTEKFKVEQAKWYAHFKAMLPSAATQKARPVQQQSAPNGQGKLTPQQWADLQAAKRK